MEAVASTVICFPFLVGWPNSLVRKDQTEVSPLSGRGYHSPYPLRYRAAFAYSVVLYPPIRWLVLRPSYPNPGEHRRGETDGLTTFRVNDIR